MDFQTIVGTIGVFILLLAYFFQLIRLISLNGYTYLLMNIVGGFIAAYSSFLIEFIPFIILEVTWAMIALVTLIRKMIIEID